ncbi:3-hydroxyacyl-CoA dehydrogenase family protein (plasmid) [Alkalihalophilus pseudofirmus]|uniref:3-hydroxyacyl-CoA dehydrogenase family protein n=1 Tax=Alkalihalophilus pseudofirmus TaxID=79885 RepID=UPI00259BF32A|nr:3-hydroxyacyl-CoA dehydrogenase family protein [Alkalihalophilus pseudofirmus]WEG19162.1 3-hydroxyacyl-CoA dehydrogenase family protein [Alkalihalophilus pseudofirmus]
MKKIGVIGAGVMGCGVAQSFAQHGYQVVLVDISEEVLIKAKEDIYNNVRFSAFYTNNCSLDPEKVLSNIYFSNNYESIKKVDFLVENVTENYELKEEVYKQVSELVNEGCILMVNTSCIPITKIAALTKDPTKVVGTHFMNPVPIKNTVETIRGYYTSEETINKTKELLYDIGKEIVLVNDYPGFVSNRISHLYMNEAAFVVQDQVATPEDVDRIFKQCYSHKMGPLETADLIGLDTVVNSLDVLFNTYQDSKFKCCPLLRKMVDAGLYGKKSGQGFYTY